MQDKNYKETMDKVIEKEEDQAQHKTKEDRKNTHEAYVKKLVESAHGTAKRT